MSRPRVDQSVSNLSHVNFLTSWQ